MLKINFWTDRGMFLVSCEKRIKMPIFSRTHSLVAKTDQNTTVASNFLARAFEVPKFMGRYTVKLLVISSI